MTKVFLVLLINMSRGPAMTTMPEPYTYDECKQLGQDFKSVDPYNRQYFCIVTPKPS